MDISQMSSQTTILDTSTHRPGRVEEAAHSLPGPGAVVLGVQLAHGLLLGQVLLVPVVHQRLPARQVVLAQHHVALHSPSSARLRI